MSMSKLSKRSDCSTPKAFLFDRLYEDFTPMITSGTKIEISVRYQSN